MTETWHDLGDVPDGVTVVDADGDMWRHGSAGLGGAGVGALGAGALIANNHNASR